MLTEFQKYLENLDISGHTIRAYVSDLKQLIKRDIISFDLELMDLQKLVNLNMTAKSKQRMKSSLRKYSRYLIKEGILKELPVKLEALDLPKVCKSIPKVNKPLHILDVLKKVEDTEIRAALYVMSTTGCRISSLVGLEVQDLVNDNIMFRIAKGNKPYASYLTPETMEAIKKHLNGRNSGYVFRQTDGRPASVDSLRNRLRRGLKEDYCNPHSIRHGVASELVENGVSLSVVKEAMNHSSVATTENYVHLDNDYIKKQLKGKHSMF